MRRKGVMTGKLTRPPRPCCMNLTFISQAAMFDGYELRNKTIIVREVRNLILQNLFVWGSRQKKRGRRLISTFYWIFLNSRIEGGRLKVEISSEACTDLEATLVAITMKTKKSRGPYDF